MNIQGRDALPRTTTTDNSSNPLLGGNDGSQFMRMLITELQAQDPMSPMDTGAMVTQMVQLNTLDQVTSIRALIQSFATSSQS